MNATPPGWYPTEHGHVRWWNGQQWADPPTAGASSDWSGDEVATPNRKRPGKGTTAALGAALLLGGGFAAFELMTSRDEASPGLSPVAAVADPGEGCARFLALQTGMLRDQVDDTEADRRMAQLRDATHDNDPLLASDLQDLIAAESAADVSEIGQLTMRRCMAAGHVTDAEAQALAAAGVAVIGAPEKASVPTPSPQPSVPVADLMEDDTLGPGEPTCAEVMPILTQHAEQLLEWLEYFGGGVAGGPWAPGEYATVRALSPETGDPIRETFTAAEGLMDDGWLDEEALEGDLPNRVFIYMEVDVLKCEDRK